LNFSPGLTSGFDPPNYASSMWEQDTTKYTENCWTYRMGEESKGVQRRGGYIDLSIIHVHAQ
jgi:hypothetical protein